jgi:copper chaperone CopZ
MRQLNLFVDGMGCRRCVREVTALLRDVPGVETVSADAARSVIHLSGTMQLPDVIAAFNGSSFTPSFLPITAESGDLQGHLHGPTE